MICDLRGEGLSVQTVVHYVTLNNIEKPERFNNKKAQYAYPTYFVPSPPGCSRFGDFGGGPGWHA
jgi:hypothetical protein